MADVTTKLVEVLQQNANKDFAFGEDAQFVYFASRKPGTIRVEAVNKETGALSQQSFPLVETPTYQFG